jgi:thiol-disulfide isomerase/thioredoxin
VIVELSGGPGSGGALAPEKDFLPAFVMAEPVDPPKPFPASELFDMDDKRHVIGDFRGKTVLVNFWAGWCQPCLAELPALEKLRKAKAGRDFDVLYVSMDFPENGAALKDSMENLPTGSFPSYYSKDPRLTLDLGVDALPVTYLLNHEGKIVYMFAGGGPWDTQGAWDFIANSPARN